MMHAPAPTPEELRNTIAGLAARLGLPGRNRASTSAAASPSADTAPDKVAYLEPFKMLMEGLPNTDRIGRDEQVAVAHAVRGAVEGTGLEAEGRTLFLDWSARWAWGGDATHDAQLYDTIRDTRIGWTWLRGYATRLDPALGERVAHADAVAVFGGSPVNSADVDALAAQVSAGSAIAHALTGFTLTPAKAPVPGQIPPRRWLYGKNVIAGFPSVLVAPGGTGKSALTTAETLAMATGKVLFSGDEPIRQLKVWSHNAEDPHDEQLRRLAAAQSHYGITDADIGGRLYMTSGRDLHLCLARMGRDGPEVVPGVVDALVDIMLDVNVDVLVLDPLGAIHSLPENDNTAINVLMGALRQIADRTGAAIVSVHHVGKAAGADMSASGASAARGASAIVDGARVVRQLVRMTEKEARQFGIADDERNHFVRVENGKANLAPAAKARWRRLVSVKLHNGTPEYPAGDTVAVVEDWTPPGPTVGTPSDLHRVQAAIQSATSKPRADKRSQSWAGYLISDALGMDVGTPGTKAADRTPEQARAFSAVSDMLDGWLADGGLRTVSEFDQRAKREVECVAAGEPAVVRKEAEGGQQ
ncbi:AAA family ATPase [Ruegeria sp.]|uniref:AAA family ATPase n=1 Tax=Ruegeria sp. TaxID=1879320 RepID=UPI003B5A1366